MQSSFGHYDFYAGDITADGLFNAPLFAPHATPAGGTPSYEPRTTSSYPVDATQQFAAETVDKEEIANRPSISDATLAEGTYPYSVQDPFAYGMDVTPPSPQTYASTGGSSPTAFSDGSYSPGEKGLMHPSEYYDATKVERVAKYATPNSHQSLNDKIANAPAINTRGGNKRGPNKLLSADPTEGEEKAFGKARGEETRRYGITAQVLSMARSAVALLRPEERHRIPFIVERVFYRLVDMVDNRDRQLTSLTSERDHLAREAYCYAIGWSKFEKRAETALAQKDDQIRQLQERLHAQAAALEDHARAAEELTRIVREA